jgi:hypothetical protein
MTACSTKYERLCSWCTNFNPALHQQPTAAKLRVDRFVCRGHSKGAGVRAHTVRLIEIEHTCTTAAASSTATTTLRAVLLLLLAWPVLVPVAPPRPPRAPASPSPKPGWAGFLRLHSNPPPNSAFAPSPPPKASPKPTRPPMSITGGGWGRPRRAPRSGRSPTTRSPATSSSGRHPSAPTPAPRNRRRRRPCACSNLWFVVSAAPPARAA